MSVREQADLDQALRGTLALELAARRLSRLIEFLDPNRSGRLACAAGAMVHDAAASTAGCSTMRCDTVVPRLGGACR